MDAATTITVSLLAAAGIIFAVLSAAELILFEELKNSVMIIRGGADTADIARAARRYGLLSRRTRLLIVCDEDEKQKARVLFANRDGILAIEKKEIADTVEYLLNV